MLQQTRAEVVADYWTRFLRRFPTVSALAAADEDDVLALWSGLGYYRRARALLAAARTIATEHGGKLPADPAALAALPGFGPYTTGAVASIAFGLAVPLVDGNVARVLTRLRCIEGVPAAGPAKRAVWSLAAELLFEPDPGTWNQALMELGARLCSPTNPTCEACPIATHCQAHAENRTTELPTRPPKKTSIEVSTEALILGTPGGWLLTRRPGTGRNPGLFELPTREASRPAQDLWPADWALPDFAALYAEAHAHGTFRHAITHHRITVHARRIDGNPALLARLASQSAYDLVPRARANDLALSGLTKKLLKAT